MRMSPLHKLLLATVLVIGQWLAIAHDYQHPLTASDPSCQVCAHGQQHQAGAASLPSADAGWRRVEAPRLPADAYAPAQRVAHARIRAPPVRLV